MEIYKDLNNPASKEFEKLLNSQLSKTKIEEGKVIEGKINKISDKFVFLFIEGLKSEPVLDINELNMIIQLAKTVQQNPAMYPQIRQMAIQRGLIPAEEIPEQYDEGLITAIIMAAKAMEADVQIEGAEGMQPQPTQMMNEGGVLIGPSHAQGGIPTKIAGVNNAEMEGGEYVIPKNVVKAKGTEFFDKMLAQYEEGGEVK